MPSLRRPPPGYRRLSAEEWDRSSDLWILLQNVEQETEDRRKAALFGVACCRLFGHLLPTEDVRLLFEFEELIDRLDNPSEEDICKAGKALVTEANKIAWGVPIEDLWRTAMAKGICYTLGGSPTGVWGYLQELDRDINLRLVPLLKDIIGNPFRPIEIESEWRNDSTVLLSQQMYKTRDFSTMPFLADALEWTGCEDERILNHCRSSETHYRGCWVVDSLLAKG